MNKYQLFVVVVSVCGHVYHGECLENLTSEVNRYDPVCPVCTFRKNKALKLSEKALIAKLDSRARNKRSRKQIVNGDQDRDLSVFGDLKRSGRYVRKGPKEFNGLYYSLRNWRSICKRFDRDRSGKIDVSELEEALRSLGFSVSPVILDLLVSKFDKTGGKSRAIEYDNFIKCCITVKAFDGLVSEMRSKEFALKVMANNAELLIFYFY